MKKKIGNILFFGICSLLISIVLCQMGFLPMRFIYIRSGSMRPTYQPGDLAVVFVWKNIEVKPRDVVLFSAKIGPTIHRVVSIEKDLITTKGDANNVEDVQKIQSVDGKVLFVIPKLGYTIDYIQTTLMSIVQIFVKPQS